MKLGPENLSCSTRFGVPNRADGGAVVFGAAAVAARNIQVMRFKTGFLEQQQRPRHQKFDIIRMRGDGNSDFTIHRTTLLNLTGLPLAAARSAPKITS